MAHHQHNRSPNLKRGLFKYQVLAGNNAPLVQRVMSETRSFLWTELSSSAHSSTPFHFRWSPLSKWVNFERLSTNSNCQMVNHYEKHGEITTKNQLYKNLKALYEAKH